MSLPDLPLQSTNPVEGVERRFEELATLQALLADRETRLAEAETALDMLRRNPTGGPAGQLQAEIETDTLKADLRRLRLTLARQEQTNADLAEKLGALTADHQDISGMLAQSSGDATKQSASRTDLVLELAALRQTVARLRFSLQAAEAKIDQTRLSAPFDTVQADNDGNAARAERRMRRQQMAMLTSLMAARAGADG